MALYDLRTDENLTFIIITDEFLIIYEPSDSDCNYSEEVLFSNNETPTCVFYK